jgi:hypothetical protein
VSTQNSLSPLLVALVLIGCTVGGQSASPGDTRATPLEIPTPTGPTADSSPSNRPPVQTLSPDAVRGTIDQRFTTPTLEYRSTGKYLLWSSGSRLDAGVDGDPDLFGSEPGGPPTLLYDNPNRDSRLELIGGDGDRIVFVEVNRPLFGVGGWKMWYLAGTSADAILVDEGTGNLPFFGISGLRLVWTVNGGNNGHSELWLSDLETMERRVLQSADATATQFWFPSIDGGHVVYSTLESTPDGRREDRHVYLLDIDGDAKPRQLDRNPSPFMGASQPTILGDIVVWKESSLDDSFVAGGRIVSYSLDSREVQPVIIDPSGPRYTFPTVGNRYVAAWSDNDRSLYLGDLESGIPIVVLDLGTTVEDPHDDVGLRADLHGDLLAFPYGPADGHLELRWVVLR